MAKTSTPTPTTKTRPVLWTRYRVTLDFITKLCGSVPADPEMVAKWLEARQPEVKPAGARSIQEINEEVMQSLAEGGGEPSQEYSLLTFQRFDQQCVLRAATVRAHVKDCARVISAQFIGKKEGERAFSTRVLNGVYHDERVYWLTIRRPDGSPIREPDGYYDKAIHVYMPGRGTVNALKRIAFIEPPASVTVDIKVLGTSVVRDDLDVIFEYGGTHGYGGERSDGQGRYTYRIETLDAEPARAATENGVGAAGKA